MEAVPNQIADQIVVGLVGNETKADLMEKIKECMVKNISIFLYRSDFHKLVQNRGELPERYAARIRQAAPPCQLMTNSGTADYEPDIMSTVFILDLSDSYTCEKLFQLQPKKDKTTVEFDALIRAASEIQQAKDNCLDAGSSLMCGVSGQQAGEGKKPKDPKACYCCNKTTHSDKGFTHEVREKYCKAFKAKCKKCDRIGHFTENGSKGEVVPQKAKASVLTAEEKEAEAAVLPATESSAVSEVLAAALNSVEQVRPYQFNPERYQDYRMENSGWWSVEAVKPIQTKRVWAKMEALSLGPA